MKTLLPALVIASAIAVTAARPQKQVSESEVSCSNLGQASDCKFVRPTGTRDDDAAALDIER